ncbi:unnamed protein product [Urochloa humidicola]
MHLLIVVLFLLPGAAFSAAAGDRGGGCVRQCGSKSAPYPFGFSGDCPIRLACNATTSTPLLPSSTAAAPYPIVSFNATTSTFVVSVDRSCNRTVAEAQASLYGAGYGVSYRTGLFLSGNCSRRSPAATAFNCSVSPQFLTTIFRTQCGGGGTDPSLACVSSTTNVPSNSTVARGQFMEWRDVRAAGCEDVLTAALSDDTAAGVPSVKFGVAELGWWLDGTCANATGGGGGQCAANATCHDVETPSGAWGHRCACPSDGFAAGEGCYYALGGESGKLPVVTVAAGVSVAFILLIIGISAFCIWRKRRYNAKATTAKAYKQVPRDARFFRGRPVDDDLDEGETGPRRFCYDELAAATEDFSDDRRLGSGGFGSVYRGYLADGIHRDVPVKRVSRTSRQGWKEFISEVRIISRLRHRNLVQLIGWCHDGDDELLLVYELMANGSLDAHLYNREHVLTWPVPFGIVLGVGAALLYLHEEAERRVVHRDIKPSNVMLDASFNAKLGDFGVGRALNSHAHGNKFRRGKHKHTAQGLAGDERRGATHSSILACY